MDKILKMQKCVDKFVGLIKYKRFHTWYVKMRKSAIIIQRAYKQRYLKRKIIETRLKEFTEEEDKNYEDSTMLNSLNLFPERQAEPQPDEKGSKATLQKWEKFQNYYDKKIKALNPNLIIETQYLNHSLYEEPKLNFFAHVLDLDAIINTDDIYPSVPWSETFQSIIEHNIKQNTPIQLIEVGEFHTTLVNTLGKAFTWGWNGNGQCGFNINKEKYYFPENNFTKAKKKRRKVKSMDFDNINNEKEEEDNWEDELFNEEKDFTEDSFIECYYLDSPVIIDNLNVRKIECGENNTMVLTKENKLYVFGGNDYYQFGKLKNKNIYSPITFQNILKSQPEKYYINSKSDIVSMKFSGKNVLLLNELGNLITLSCFKEEASNNKTLNTSPIELYVPEAKFSTIECGKDFCLLLTNSGVLYSFGSNNFGQLGHGDKEKRTYPTAVKFFIDMKKRVEQISCGYKHSACKCNNKIYTWGCNSCGQLGTGNLKHMYSPNLVDIKYSKINFNFLQVSCGFRSTVFLTETRKLFWCGTCGDIQQQLEPIEFMYNLKIPELFSYDNHIILKINHTYSRTMSILYATVAEIGPLKRKLNNPVKLNKILNGLTNKWNTKDVYPPIGEDLDKYFALKHINRDLKINKGKKK